MTNMDYLSISSFWLVYFVAVIVFVSICSCFCGCFLSSMVAFVVVFGDADLTPSFPW